MNYDVLLKRVEWALKQKLSAYEGVEYSEENLHRIIHEASMTIERVMEDK